MAVRVTRGRLRPRFEAACEVAAGERRLVAYSGHHRVIRLVDPAAREDVAVLQDSRTWIRALCAVRVDGTALLASGGRDGVVRLWDGRPLIVTAGYDDGARVGRGRGTAEPRETAPGGR